MQTLPVVQVAVALPMSKADFERQEDLFVAALAKSAGVGVAAVSIISVTETSGGVRRVLAPSVEVKSEIQTSDVSSVIKALTADTLNKHLGDAGLPKATGIKVREGGRGGGMEGGREGKKDTVQIRTYVHTYISHILKRARARARSHARTQIQTQVNVRDPPPAATPTSHAVEKDTLSSPLPLIIGVAVGGGVFCLAAGAWLLWKCGGMQRKSNKLSPLPVTSSPSAVVPEIEKTAEKVEKMVEIEVEKIEAVSQDVHVSNMAPREGKGK